MYKIFLFIISFLLTNVAFAQNYVTEKTVKGKTLKQYEKANQYAFKSQYSGALELLNRTLKSEPRFIDAYIAKARIQFQQKKYREAEQNFEKALALDPSYSHFIYYMLGVTRINLKKFDKAVENLNFYLSTQPKSEKYTLKAQEHIARAQVQAQAYKRPIAFNPQNLGSNINTAGLEYFPSLTVDQQTLVYTVRLGSLSSGQEDFYMSQLVSGKWSKGLPIEGINTPLNEGAQSISANGKLLFFTACHREDGMGECDLMYAEKRDNRWTTAQNLGRPINSKASEKQPSISANGEELYFSSDRKNSDKNMDIYVSRRQKDGTWATPQNLGENINTSGREETPFIHPDGQTLYFMSNGHPGMGQADIFFARRQADGSWGKAQNMGYPINTEHLEGFLVVSLDGKTGYFASDRPDLKGAQGLLDIYSFAIPQHAKPQAVTYVKAKVKDATTGKPLSANVEFTDLNTTQVFASSVTDNEGEFLLCLPMGKDYALNVSKKKYTFHSENFALTGVNSFDKPYLMEIELIPLLDKPSIASDNDSPTPNRAIILKNVFFETASAALRAISLVELNRLKQLLLENPNLNIQINGHTDNVGSDADNLKLSENRAKAVYDYLVKNEINANRLKYKGFGETQPIDTNDTKEGRQNNRRTEFIILK